MKTCEVCGEVYPTSIKARWWKCFCVRKLDAIAVLFSRRTISEKGCWIYTGPESGEGYGAFAMVYKRKNTRNAHRTAYLIFKGPIPDGMDVHHSCETKRCFNPEHLILKAVIDHRRLHQLVTHCIVGHEYTSENTYVSKAGKKCRTCHRVRERLKRLYPNPEDRKAVDITTLPEWVEPQRSQYYTQPPSTFQQPKLS